MHRRFADRREAGRELARRLGVLDADRTVVFALPRGGVPVAFEIAAANRCPLDLLLVRKIGVPGHRELALGAIVGGEPPVTVVNAEIAQAAGIGGERIAALAAPELQEIARQSARYGAGAPRDLKEKTAIVVDDGLATGATARAALEALRQRGAARTILAVPVAPRGSLKEFAGRADEVICLDQPEPFLSVSRAYENFEQVDDEEVAALLAQARAQAPMNRG